MYISITRWNTKHSPSPINKLYTWKYKFCWFVHLWLVCIAWNEKKPIKSSVFSFTKHHTKHTILGYVLITKWFFQNTHSRILVNYLEWFILVFQHMINNDGNCLLPRWKIEIKFVFHKQNVPLHDQHETSKTLKQDLLLLIKIPHHFKCLMETDYWWNTGLFQANRCLLFALASPKKPGFLLP